MNEQHGFHTAYWDTEQHGFDTAYWDDLNEGWRIDCLCKWCSTVGTMEESGGEFDQHLTQSGTKAEDLMKLRALNKELAQAIETRNLAQAASTRDLEAKRQAERERDNWRNTAEQENRNSAYYRGLLQQIGDIFGLESRTSDDGSLQDSVLCAKVPELVWKHHQTGAMRR